ncbi:unnamed protein product [Caretta caretta]
MSKYKPITTTRENTTAIACTWALYQRNIDAGSGKQTENSSGTSCSQAEHFQILRRIRVVLGLVHTHGSRKASAWMETFKNTRCCKK